MVGILQRNKATCQGGVLRTTMTLEACLDDWADVLHLLHRPPPTRDWRSDTGYGLMDIYVEAAGLPADYRPHINIIHALMIGKADHWYHTSEAGFRSVPAIFVHNEPDRIHLERVLGSKKRILIAPHPFHYVVQNYATAATELKREGSVFFMPHTNGQPWPCVPVGYVLQHLRELPEEYHPVDICLHPNDVTEELVSTFQAHKFGVVTAGHRHDPLFLHRFFWLCRRRHYSITVDYGTQVWLSSLAGCEIHILRDCPNMRWIPANNSLEEWVTPRSHYWPLLDALGSIVTDQAQVKGLIRRLTGGDQWRSARELRTSFQNAEGWYKDWRGPGGQFGIPARYWTPIEPLLRKARSMRIALLNRLSGRRGRWQPVCEDLDMKLIAYERAMSAGNIDGNAGVCNPPGVRE